MDPKIIVGTAVTFMWMGWSWTVILILQSWHKHDVFTNGVIDTLLVIAWGISAFLLSFLFGFKVSNWIASKGW